MIPIYLNILNKCSERIEYTKLFQITKKTSSIGMQLGWLSEFCIDRKLCHN